MSSEQVQTDDAVGVDVRVHGDGAVRMTHKDDFRWFWRDGQREVL
mgnify:CR=1 FL=1